MLYMLDLLWEVGGGLGAANVHRRPTSLRPLRPRKPKRKVKKGGRKI